MITHGKDIKIFSGNSNPELAKAICQELGLPLGDSECGTFSDGESFVSTLRPSAAATYSWSSPPAPPV